MKYWERFDEPELPTKELFYSSLKESHISDDYAHAQEVFI